MNDIADLVAPCVDGGICSMIEFVASGLCMKRTLGEDVRLKYDFFWYRQGSKGIDGQPACNWDFPKRCRNVVAARTSVARRLRLTMRSRQLAGQTGKDFSHG